MRNVSFVLTDLKTVNIEVSSVPSEPGTSIPTALPPALQPLLALQTLPHLLQVLARHMLLELSPVTECQATKLPTTDQNQHVVPEVVPL